MSLKPMNAKARARGISWYILGGGLALGLVLHLAMPPVEEDHLRGIVESRRYLHDLEAYGGKINVMQDQFHRWFVGLWCGKQLGITVAWLSALVFAGIHLVLSVNRFEGRGTEKADPDRGSVDGPGRFPARPPENGGAPPEGDP
jgi:hypothetical protein